jgi:hypothetical protein
MQSIPQWNHREKEQTGVAYRNKYMFYVNIAQTIKLEVGKLTSGSSVRIRKMSVTSFWRTTTARDEAALAALGRFGPTERKGRNDVLPVGYSVGAD